MQIACNNRGKTRCNNRLRVSKMRWCILRKSVWRDPKDHPVPDPLSEFQASDPQGLAPTPESVGRATKGWKDAV